jgi:hypothetical protein
MAKKIGFTVERLEAMGLSKNEDGSYSKKVESKPKQFEISTVKEKVNNSPDFQHKIITEWFITYSIPSKKNSRINFVRNGKQVSIPSKNHAEYKKLTAMQYNVFGKEFRNAIDFFNLKKPYRVQFTFIRSTKHRSDFTNILQTVEDLMVENKWIEDDDMNTLIPSFMPREDDKNNPGVRIKLLIP